MVRAPASTYIGLSTSNPAGVVLFTIRELLGLVWSQAELSMENEAWLVPLDSGLLWPVLQYEIEDLNGRI
ncbi:hypothetical protein [Mycobacterium lepromatosis]|uniref:hypothetical protein n=1 Tax=Mycobacterium lepromatosis TaxID=480418 RepID=UPI0005F8277F|nr:hypothetical protein [Mycobacterium lepromatosis]